MCTTLLFCALCYIKLFAPNWYMLVFNKSYPILSYPNQLSSNLMLSPLSPDTSADILCKRAIFFDSVHQVIQRFGSYDPALTLRLVSVYSTAFYGSTLWKLDSEQHQKFVDHGTQLSRSSGSCHMQLTIDFWKIYVLFRI